MGDDALVIIQDGQDFVRIVRFEQVGNPEENRAHGDDDDVQDGAGPPALTSVTRSIALPFPRDDQPPPPRQQELIRFRGHVNVGNLPTERSPTEVGKTRPAYAPAFREEAVRLVRSSGKRISEIAAEREILKKAAAFFAKEETR